MRLTHHHAPVVMAFETLEFMNIPAHALVTANEVHGLEFPYSGDAPQRMRYRLAQCRKRKDKDS